MGDALGDYDLCDKIEVGFHPVVPLSVDVLVVGVVTHILPLNFLRLFRGAKAASPIRVTPSGMTVRPATVFSQRSTTPFTMVSFDMLLFSQ